MLWRFRISVQQPRPTEKVIKGTKQPDFAKRIVIPLAHRSITLFAPVEDVRFRTGSTCAHTAPPAQVWRPAARINFFEVVSQGTMSKVSTGQLWHMPISGMYEIKRVGDVLARRVEQGVVKPGEKVVFLRTRQVQSVHPQCLHSSASNRQAQMATWA